MSTAGPLTQVHMHLHICVHIHLGMSTHVSGSHRDYKRKNSEDIDCGERSGLT